MSKFNAVLAIAVIGVLALSGANADAGQPANGGQQRQAVQKQAVQKQAVQKPRVVQPRFAAAAGTQATKYNDIELKPPLAGDSPSANKPKPPSGAYSKTLTFTLSTTSPAPPVSDREIVNESPAAPALDSSSPKLTQLNQHGKGGNDVAVEGITLVHEKVDVQSGIDPVHDVAWVSGKGGTRGSSAGASKTAAPTRTTD